MCWDCPKAESPKQIIYTSSSQPFRHQGSVSWKTIFLQARVEGIVAAKGLSDIPNLPEFQLIRFKPERPRLAQTLIFLWFRTKWTQAFVDSVLGRASSVLTASTNPARILDCTCSCTCWGALRLWNQPGVWVSSDYLILSVNAQRYVLLLWGMC